MLKMTVDQARVTPELAETLTKACPFGALAYEGGKLEPTAGCKLCRLCAKASGGAIRFEEDEDSLNRDAWRGVCVYAQREGNGLHPVTGELLGKARSLADALGQKVIALWIGADAGEAAQTLLRAGADKVYLYDEPELADFLVEPYANAFCDFIGRVKPASILVGATSEGRSLAPRVAARLRTGLTADCTSLEMKPNSDLVQIRPAFGGNIMARIVTPRTRPQFCTVRYKIFQAAAERAPEGEVERVRLPKEKLQSRVKLVQSAEKPHEIDISEAETVVAVGRGLRSKADIALAQTLADALDAQLACTRPLVEAGWFDPRRQIGLSGRTVAAKLIVTLGVSGSVQFAAGMKGSSLIAAVNSDPRAPIFDVAHYGFVGDLYEVVPKLLKRIEEARA